MVMSESQAKEAAEELLKVRRSEYERLDKVHKYIRGTQPHPITPRGLPSEVQRLKEMSRVNIMDIVVSSVTQAMFVDGYRAEREQDNAPAWSAWQVNRMDAMQTGVHRSALGYGTSYVSVLPGDTAPAMRGYSPRFMTTVYDDDDQEWPVWAMRAIPAREGWRFRLYDNEAVYRFASSGVDISDFELQSIERHGAGVTPIVRFLNQRDLDEDNDGEVEPLMKLQDQIDLTTFSLLVAQHYGAFRQRYIIGWIADSEEEMFKVGASRMLTLEDSPDDVKVGEFEQTELKGYLDSREASLRHAATLSQTPVHELIGQMVNLSAEALVAAESGQRRKIAERQMSFGESWEQVLALAGSLGNFEATEMAQVRWRDTESRALSATVDALGKMAEMLHIPPQELWYRVPGATNQEVERWRAAYQSGDVLSQFKTLLERQEEVA